MITRSQDHQITRSPDHQITIHKLRKLLGIVKSSENLKGVLGSSTDEPTGKPQKKRKKPKKPPSVAVKPEVKYHPLVDLKKGDECPKCETGKLYKYEPASFLRISGQSPFKSEKHIMERLRCNACGQFFTADLADELKNDGGATQKYGHSARSLMAISKFYAGSPYYRQGSMQDLLGVPLTASSIFDQVESVADCAYPVVNCIRRIAANGRIFLIDDTGRRILNQKPIIKKKRNSDKEMLRTGVYTSGLISKTADGKTITLFQTNIGHAGEHLDEILSLREGAPLPPIIMSDALSSNRPSKGTESVESLCNAHGRRQFVDVAEPFSDEVKYVLELYQKIWILDDQIKEKGLSDKERLEKHKAESLPVMQEIRDGCIKRLADDTVEHNSGLGRAMRYFNKHFDGLTRFCQVEGAPIDNNEMETALKISVRDRKNAMFHKTLSGASIGDVITSLIVTAADACVNVFEYFNALQRYAREVQTNPEKFLPWNYQETLLEMEGVKIESETVS